MSPLHVEVIRDDVRLKLNPDRVIAELERIPHDLLAAHARTAGLTPERVEIAFNPGVASVALEDVGLAMYAQNEVYVLIDDIVAVHGGDTLAVRTIAGVAYGIAVGRVARVLRFLMLAGSLPDQR